jgi:hypothetical protein
MDLKPPSVHNMRVLVADQGMVRSTRKSLGGTDNKGNPLDALVMVALYQRHYLEVYDRRYWVIDRPEEIKQMKRVLLDLISNPGFIPPLFLKPAKAGFVRIVEGENRKVRAHSILHPHRFQPPCHNGDI